MLEAMYTRLLCQGRVDPVREKGESAILSTPLGRCLAALDEVSYGRVKLKFDICYTMAKQSLLFAKYPALLELEAHHTTHLTQPNYLLFI